MELAGDPRFLGAQIGLVGVLQTWTREMRYHPHVHYLAPGGGLADDGRSWVTAKADFLLHVKPLAALFRAKLRAALRQTALWAEIPAAAWQQPWVVDCRPVGTARAALSYLAPYIFRVALSNNRIVQLADDQVTFGYTIGATGQTAYCTLPVQEFLRRFLQHILPKGFVKVRYYGLFRLGMRRSLARLRGQLQLLQHIADQATLAPAASDGRARVVTCPSCGQPMRLQRVLLPHNRGPPGWATSTRANAGQVQAPCGVASQLHACFGVPWRSSDGQMHVQFRPRPAQSCADACERASGQHARAACVRTSETANHRRAAFEPSLPRANPHMKFHIE
jgi:hypothetical protein